MSLSTLMSTGLPLNRKKQFYTGTVLPMIACAADFLHFDKLAELMGVGDLEIDARPQSANIQFFTEYAFALSAITAAAKKKFPAGAPSRETPDPLVYVEDEPKRIFAVEAKMFHRPRKGDLVEQIHKQQVLLEHIRTSLVIETKHVHHAALLPQPFAKETGKLPIPTVTWESFLAAYEGVGPAYFLEMLRLALDGYDKGLKGSKTATFGANKNWRMSGAEIHDRYLDDTLEYPFMGRQGGLDGKGIAKDFQTGQWLSRMYEVRSKPLPGKPNWFAVADFVAKVEHPQA